MKKVDKTQKIKDEDFAKFCHDIRNPLTILRMNLDLFVLSPEYKKESKEVKKFVDIVEKEVSILISKVSKK